MYLLLLTPTAAAPKSAHVAEAHGAPRVDESRGHNRSSRRRVPPPQAAAAAAFTESSREEIASALAKEASHSTADFCFVSVAFLVASFVHGIAGFGAGIVAMSIVPLQLPVMEAVPIVAVFSLCICAGLALQLRGALSNPSVRPVLLSLVVGCVIGVPLGGVLLTRADPRWLRIALGMCMLLFVGERVMHEDDGAAAERRAYAAVAEGDAHALRPVAMEQIQPSPLTSPSVSPRLLSRLGRPIEAEEPPASPKIKHRGRRTIDHPLVGVAVGLASGVLGGALNEAGPPVVIYLTLKQWPKDDVKATLQVDSALPPLPLCTYLCYLYSLARLHFLPSLLAGVLHAGLPRRRHDDGVPRHPAAAPPLLRRHRPARRRARCISRGLPLQADRSGALRPHPRRGDARRRRHLHWPCGGRAARGGQGPAQPVAPYWLDARLLRGRGPRPSRRQLISPGGW